MIEIYTDGACRGNPGPGGWGYVKKIKDYIQRDFGGSKETTNGRMELKALKKALETILYTKKDITVYTDSKYVCDSFNKYMHTWVKKDWRKANGRPVIHKDLWEYIYNKSLEMNIKCVWVKAHNGNKGNEEADFLANKGLDNEINRKDII